MIEYYDEDELDGYDSDGCDVEFGMGDSIEGSESSDDWRDRHVVVGNINERCVEQVNGYSVEFEMDDCDTYNEVEDWFSLKEFMGACREVDIGSINEKAFSLTKVARGSNAYARKLRTIAKGTEVLMLWCADKYDLWNGNTSYHMGFLAKLMSMKNVSENLEELNKTGIPEEYGENVRMRFQAFMLVLGLLVDLNNNSYSSFAYLDYIGFSFCDYDDDYEDCFVETDLEKRDAPYNIYSYGDDYCVGTAKESAVAPIVDTGDGQYDLDIACSAVDIGQSSIHYINGNLTINSYNRVLDEVVVAQHLLNSNADNVALVALADLELASPFLMVLALKWFIGSSMVQINRSDRLRAFRFLSKQLDVVPNQPINVFLDALAAYMVYQNEEWEFEYPQIPPNNIILVDNEYIAAEWPRDYLHDYAVILQTFDIEVVFKINETFDGCYEYNMFFTSGGVDYMYYIYSKNRASYISVLQLVAVMVNFVEPDVGTPESS